MVTDTLPPNVALSGFAGGPPGSVSGSQITWNLGSLPAGSAVTLSFTVTVQGSAPNGSSLSNQAILSYLGGSNAANSSDVTVVAATATPTVSATRTATATPTLQASAILYPNPSVGTSVQLNPGLVSASAVQVQYFTLAFRKVNELDFSQVGAGGTLTLPLRDEWGNPLANGLYYVVVISNRGRSVEKLLILR